MPVFGDRSTVEHMKKRKPKRKSKGKPRRKRPSPADVFRKQLTRWGDEGRKLQKQYDKLHKQGDIQHIEMFELGFEPLLVEITPISIDFEAMQQAPQGDAGTQGTQ